MTEKNPPPFDLTKPGRFTGVESGLTYVVKEDGTVKLHPSLQERFRQLQYEGLAIRNFADDVHRMMIERRLAHAKATQELWEQIFKDFGMPDIPDNWRVNLNGYVYPPEKKEEKP